MRYLVEEKSYEEQKAEAEEAQRQKEMAEAWLLGQKQAKKNWNAEAYRRNIERKRIEEELERHERESDQTPEKEE